jgi:hypothetical protein
MKKLKKKKTIEMKKNKRKADFEEQKIKKKTREIRKRRL